jgi:5-methylcytosine-specific restriction protein B
MNSTDKSIALIDIALRRRFTFLQMKPDESLIKDDISREIFKKLNELISIKLGDDYLLGHSYFMNGDLEFVLEYKIKPLMQEYFYGDDSGLEEVLNIIRKNLPNLWL